MKRSAKSTKSLKKTIEVIKVPENPTSSSPSEFTKEQADELRQILTIQ